MYQNNLKNKAYFYKQDDNKNIYEIYKYEG